MASREAVMTALFNLLSASASFVTKGRRLVDPEGAADIASPALFLVEHEDDFGNDPPRHPPVQKMNVLAVVYVDTGADVNAVPATQLNAIVDALVLALAPDNKVSRRCTLGGLVSDVWITGIAPRASGDVTGKAMSVIPISILLP